MSRALSSPLALLCGALCAVIGCSSRNTVGPGVGDEPDMAVVAPPDLAGPCDAQHPCAEGQLCRAGVCLPDYGRCNVDSDCLGDTVCDCGTDAGVRDDAGFACECRSWDSPPRSTWDATCRRPPYSLAEVVTPKLLCAYVSDAAETSPLIGDLDGDGLPEVVFMTTGGGLHAMHGADCSPYFDTRFDFAEWNASQLAMGDLDGDGRPEIVGVDRSRRVAVFDNRGELLASSQLPYLFSDGAEELGGVAIADIDGKAPPEIILAGQVLRYSGAKGPKRELKQVWVQSPAVPFWGALSAAADINGDGTPEVLSGKSLWSGSSGDDRTPAPLAQLEGPGAYPAIADFNLDGKPDLALVMAGSNTRRVAIYDFANRTFLLDPVIAPEAWGGPPVVADFDGDGRPEVGVGGIDAFTVYAPRCGGARPAPECDGKLPGVLWERKIQDHSSGSSGAAAFDFNGDGAAEIVFRDECWLRAIDGKNGKALFALPATSATGVEVPVIADVDGDGHADIIVSSTAFPNCDGHDEPETGAHWSGVTNGVMIYSDPMKKWMPARPVWNQHTYHVTNVNDDLTIPEHETPGWTVWNGYRQNEQGIAGKPAGIGDFTARAPIVGDMGPMDCAAHWTLWAQICNRGAGTVQKGVPGTFYLSDPRTGSPAPLCSVTTTKSLVPGACEQLSCDWIKPSQTKADLWFRADDDGAVFPQREECRTDNDLLLERNARCKPIQ